MGKQKKRRALTESGQGLAECEKALAKCQQELKIRKEFSNSENIGTVLRALIKYGAIAFLGWCAYQSIDSLAGKETSADIGVSFLGSLKLKDAFALTFGVGGILYGHRCRILQKRTIKQFEGRKKKYEQEKDPKRSSSELTADGRTNPDDLEG